MRVLTLDDDRLLPTDPGYAPSPGRSSPRYAGLPLVSMHGHVDAALLSHNLPFPDPARLLVVPDHYVTRMLVSQGESLDRLGLARSDGGPVETDSREIWRRFCAGWHLFRGTPSRLWLEHELAEVFGVDIAPSAESADLLYDQLSAALRRPEFRPRALFERFNIELLATTDSPLSNLAEHLSIIESGWPGVVVPTFRPDALIELNHPDWQASMQTLADVSGIPTGTYTGYSPRSSSAATTSSGSARGRPTTASTPRTPSRSTPVRPRASTSRRCADGLLLSSARHSRPT